MKKKIITMALLMAIAQQTNALGAEDTKKWYQKFGDYKQKASKSLASGLYKAAKWLDPSKDPATTSSKQNTELEKTNEKKEETQYDQNINPGSNYGFTDDPSTIGSYEGDLVEEEPYKNYEMSDSNFSENNTSDQGISSMEASNQMQMMQQTIQQKELEIQSLKKQNEEIKNSKNQSPSQEAACLELSKENNFLIEDINKLKEIIQSKQNDEKELLKKLEKSEKELEYKNNELENTNIKIDNSTNELQSKEEQIQNMQSDLAEKQSRIEDLMAQVEDLPNLEALVRSTQADNDFVRNLYDNCQKQLESQNINYDEIDSNNQSSNYEIEKLVQMIQEERQAHQEALAMLNQENQEKLEQLIQKNRDLQNQLYNS